MKKVLVTGGAGYIGSVLVPKLLQKNYKVIVLDRLFFGIDGLKNMESNKNLQVVKGDIRDTSLIDKLTRGIDAIIHLAAISNDPSGELNPDLTVKVNYKATANLVKIAKKNGVRRFINASSSSVYGIKEEPDVTEELPLEPLTIYSKTKAWAEEVVRESADKTFTAVSIRCATVCGYSPRMRLDLTVNILTAHAINKGIITVFGGEQKRPNIQIEDITDWYINLLKVQEEKITGEVFNAGYENYTIMEIAKMVKNIVGKHIEIKKEETRDRRSYHICSEKIKRVLGFKPEKTVKDAIMDVKDAFERGKIKNWEDTNYYNVKKMKLLRIE